MLGQNTEKSPGDLRRLAVTQAPMRNHPPTLVWKSRNNNNNNRCFPGNCRLFQRLLQRSTSFSCSTALYVLWQGPSTSQIFIGLICRIDFLHSLIEWLTVSSLSPHNLHLQHKRNIRKSTIQGGKLCTRNATHHCTKNETSHYWQ